MRLRVQIAAGRSAFRSQRSAGGELVEFAVILPCLLLLMLMVSEGAGVVATHQVLNNAAREGARLAVVPGELNLTSDVKNRVVSYAAANGLSLTTSNVAVAQNLIVHPAGAACSSTNPCISASKVTVSYTYPLTYLPRLGFGMPNSVALGASVEMRNFY